MFESRREDDIRKINDALNELRAEMGLKEKEYHSGV
jgi:hypothetical protein